MLNNMLQLLVVALLASAGVAEDVKPAKATETAVPIEAQAAEPVATVTKDAQPSEQRLHMPSRLQDHPEDYHNDHLYLQAKLDGHRPEGPLVARTLHSSIGQGPNIAAQDEIIRFTYSPAYYEPMWVLDYRFLKSGGRRYTRGPGGQVLILPRSYKHYKGDDTYDYDSMVEHLRLKLIAEQNQRNREHGFAHQHDQGHHYEQPIHHGEHEPIHHREEPIYPYGPVKPMYMERERGPMFMENERGPLYMEREREKVHMERERGPMHMEREREPLHMGMMKMGRDHRMYH